MVSGESAENPPSLLNLDATVTVALADVVEHFGLANCQEKILIIVMCEEVLSAVAPKLGTCGFLNILSGICQHLLYLLLHIGRSYR